MGAFDPDSSPSDTATERARNVFLDTSVIHQLLDPKKGIALEDELRSLLNESGACLRLPSPMLYELVEQLERDKLWESWNLRRRAVAALVDRTHPVAVELERGSILQRKSVTRSLDELAAERDHQLEVFADVWRAWCDSGHRATFNALFRWDCPEVDKLAYFAALKNERLDGFPEMARAFRARGLAAGMLQDDLDRMAGEVSLPELRDLAVRGLRAPGKERQVDRNTPIDALVHAFGEIPGSVVLTRDRKAPRAPAWRVLILGPNMRMPRSWKALECAIDG